MTDYSVHSPGCRPLTIKVIRYSPDEAIDLKFLVRYTETGLSSTIQDTSRPERTGVNAPCAIVPLKPNELRRPEEYDSQLCTRTIISAGMSNDEEETIDQRCKFNLCLDFSLGPPWGISAIKAKLCRRSCVLVATTIIEWGASTRDARPAAAADGSRWPIFDFKEAHCTAASDLLPAPTYPHHG